MQCVELMRKVLYCFDSFCPSKFREQRIFMVHNLLNLSKEVSLIR